MSMIPCPGCGLPRVAEQVGVVACPVCAAGADSPDTRPGLAKKAVAPDPTAGLPADTSELHRHAAGGFPPWFAGAALFALGLAAGAAGLLAWQGAFAPDKPVGPPVEVASAPRPLPPLPPRRVEVAPMPREFTPPPEMVVTETVPPPDPKTPAEPPPPTRVITYNLNKPNELFSLPSTTRKGDHVVLRGEVKHLKMSGLDEGANVDATGLKVQEVSVSGKIDGRSRLKLKVPNGFVALDGAIGGRSRVEIDAPGGTVRFGTRLTKATSLIDAGATVVVNARGIDVSGDVNGVETKMTATLPPTGSLRLGAVRGIATVEYRVLEGKGTADISVGQVSPTANFKKLE